MSDFQLPALAATTFAVVFLFVPPLVAPEHAAETKIEHIVTLTRVATVSCDDKQRWSNLFFEKDSVDARRSTALFAEVPDARIEVIRHEEPGGKHRYEVVSTNQRAKVLRFSNMSNGQCATIEVAVRGARKPVRVQVALVDKYVYGRIAEHREGKFNTADGPVTLHVYASHRGAARFDRASELQLFLDAGNDGKIRWTSRLDSTGAVQFSDRIGATFTVADDSFVIDSISHGSRLFLRRVADIRSASRSFAAPDFVGISLDHQRYNLSDYTGRLVVVEMWSTECPFSEQARPQTRLLAKELENIGGLYLSMARESSADSVRAHVNERPRGGIVLVRDDTTWNVWNAETATPLFYVIAPNGKILLREAGASAVRLVAAFVGIDLAKISISNE